MDTFSKSFFHSYCFIFFHLMLFNCSGQDKEAEEWIKVISKKTSKYYNVLPEPRSIDWLAKHKEKGQTFLEYLKINYHKPSPEQNVIYIVQLGKFNKQQKRVLETTGKYLEIFFGLPIKFLDKISLKNVPDNMQRFHKSFKTQQIKTSYLLYQVLKPKLPDDACLLLGFTSTDLYPSDKWNYVFGQASLHNKVGVWSIYRFGNPKESFQAFQNCLKRTLKTASHETGHTFSISHCTAYNCNMSGSNHLGELDQRPTAFCPQCMAKISWNLELDLVERAKKLAAFWRDLGFEEEKEHYENIYKSLDKL